MSFGCSPKIMHFLVRFAMTKRLKWWKNLKKKTQDREREKHYEETRSFCKKIKILQIYKEQQFTSFTEDSNSNF